MIPSRIFLPGRPPRAEPFSRGLRALANGLDVYSNFRSVLRRKRPFAPTHGKLRPRMERRLQSPKFPPRSPPRGRGKDTIRLQLQPHLRVGFISASEEAANN
jgi:hypothetical protein